MQELIKKYILTEFDNTLSKAIPYGRLFKSKEVFFDKIRISTK